MCLYASVVLGSGMGALYLYGDEDLLMFFLNLFMQTLSQVGDD